jgi:hypothetical protein
VGAGSFFIPSYYIGDRLLVEDRDVWERLEAQRPVEFEIPRLMMNAHSRAAGRRQMTVPGSSRVSGQTRFIFKLAGVVVVVPLAV